MQECMQLMLWRRTGLGSIGQSQDENQLQLYKNKLKVTCQDEFDAVQLLLLQGLTWTFPSAVPKH